MYLYVVVEEYVIGRSGVARIWRDGDTKRRMQKI